MPLSRRAVQSPIDYRSTIRNEDKSMQTMSKTRAAHPAPQTHKISETAC
jgi:hypothetical protein